MADREVDLWVISRKGKLRGSDVYIKRRLLNNGSLTGKFHAIMSGCIEF